jgi:hypothetical protein
MLFTHDAGIPVHAQSHALAIAVPPECLSSPRVRVIDRPAVFMSATYKAEKRSSVHVWQACRHHTLQS